MQGTNAEKGKKLILDAKLKIIPIDDMTEAAKASVEIAEMCRKARELNLDINLTPKANKSENECKWWKRSLFFIRKINDQSLYEYFLLVLFIHAVWYI